MLVPFELKDDDAPGSLEPARVWTPEEKEYLQRMDARRLTHEKILELETLLLNRIKEHKSELEEMLQTMSNHRHYEDSFYRFYHGSFKVCGIQMTVEKAVKLLKRILPERELNLSFEKIIHEGTGKQFGIESNQNWGRHTRPMLEAFAHAKYMVEMAVRYSTLASPPQPLPSGWAAFLYLYDLR